MADPRSCQQQQDFRNSFGDTHIALRVAADQPSQHYKLKLKLMRLWLTGFLIVARAFASDAGPGNITFNKDVLPILQKHCQVCHRPGEIGPMPLLTYAGTRPWAKSIKNAVLTRKMPPWLADPKYGHFSNDRSLSEKDMHTICGLG